MSFSVLCDYCRWKEFDDANYLLEINESRGKIIDVTKDDGSLFGDLVEKDQHEMLSSLIKYYIKHSDKCSGNLTDILEEIIEEADEGEISEKTMDVIDSYLYSDDDTDDSEGDSSHSETNSHLIFSEEADPGGVFTRDHLDLVVPLSGETS